MARFFVQGKPHFMATHIVLGTKLTVSLQNNLVRAGWAHDHSIPVSMSMAQEILGVRHEPCPRSGTSPDALFGQGPYKAYSTGNSFETGFEASVTREHCAICGYETTYSSHDTKRLLQGHPEMTYLVADQRKRVITTAAWSSSENCLVTSSDTEQTLIVWRKAWSPKKERGRQLALKTNPGAKIIAEIDSYIILLYDQQ